MLRAVLFDYGGVLSPAGGAGSIKSMIAVALGVPRDEVTISDLHQSFRLGLITGDVFLEGLHQRYPTAAMPTSAIFLGSTGLLARNILLYTLATQLRDNGIRTGILSDIYPPTAEMLRAHGCYDGFDPIVLSCEEHLRKPDPAFYHRAIDKLGFVSSEILFIDDQGKNLVGAKDVGLQVLHAVSTEQVMVDMRQIVLEQNGVTL
jgi:epoxide hydrolase-like predicted phosphatase